MPRFLLPKFAVSSLVVFLLCGFPGHQTPADSTPPAIAERPFSVQESLNPFVDLVRAKRENEARLREALQKPVTISFGKTPLDEAMKRLGQVAGVPIWIDRTSLQEEGVRIDEPITYKSQGVTLYQTFKHILEPLGLEYEIEDEIIKITTVIVALERREVRYYEVEDLLQWEEKHRYERRALSTTLISTHRPHDWLLDLVEQETGGPWFPLDGTGGTAEVHGTLLVVEQTQSVHKEIPAVLKMLRLFTEGGFGRDRSVFLQSLSPFNSDLAAK